MDFFDTVTTQRAIDLESDPIPEAVLRQIVDAAICPSGGNRQGWSFLVIRDAAKGARGSAGSTARRGAS